MVRDRCMCAVEFEIQDMERTEFDIGDPVIAGTFSKETYDGECDVTPKINEMQVLQTKDKVMPDDVRVHEISVSSVSNPHGGRTVTIGIV